MSTTQTSHEPDPRELEHVAAQSDDHVGAAHVTGHDAVKAGHDEHGHGSETLGPVDVRAWGALALGIAAGLVVVLCLLITNSLVAKPAI